jgi:hypothetical protein
MPPQSNQKDLHPSIHIAELVCDLIGLAPVQEYHAIPLPHVMLQMANINGDVRAACAVLDISVTVRALLRLKILMLCRIIKDCAEVISQIILRLSGSIYIRFYRRDMPDILTECGS